MIPLTGGIRIAGGLAFRADVYDWAVEFDIIEGSLDELAVRRHGHVIGNDDCRFVLLGSLGEDNQAVHDFGNNQRVLHFLDIEI